MDEGKPPQHFITDEDAGDRVVYIKKQLIREIRAFYRLWMNTICHCDECQKTDGVWRSLGKINTPKEKFGAGSKVLEALVSHIASKIAVEYFGEKK